MSDHVDPSTKQTQLSIGPARARWLAVGALVVAGLPHFFLQTPLGFYDEANANGWLGLTIWAPTFLAAIALFVGVDTNARSDKPLIANSDMRMAAGVAVPILVLVALVAINFDGYQRVGDWSHLGLAAVVYAGVFSVGTFFWQGLLQQVVLGKWPPVVRAPAVAAAGAALWLPFLANHPFSQVDEPLLEYIIVYFGVALLFELGVPVLACAGAALLMGVAYAWAHQMVFF